MDEFMQSEIDGFIAQARYMAGLMAGEGDFADEPQPTRDEWVNLLNWAERIMAMQDEGQRIAERAAAYGTV
jgi:hypothetical protein